MSTRCQVSFYGGWPHAKTKKWVRAKRSDISLYHHEDGTPAFMVGKIHRFLAGASELIAKRWGNPWWDPGRVADAMLLLSVEDYSVPLLPYSTDRPDRRDYVSPDGMPSLTMPYRVGNGAPAFGIGGDLHFDIEWLYKVFLGPMYGEYELQAFSVGNYEDDKLVFKRFKLKPSTVPKKLVTPEPAEI